MNGWLFLTSGLKYTRYSHRANRSNTSTVPMPWRYVCRTEKDHQPTSSYHFPATCRCRESNPDRSSFTRGSLANYDLKDKMSPNYELFDIVHCFLGNILIKWISVYRDISENSDTNNFVIQRGNDANALFKEGHCPFISPEKLGRVYLNFVKDAFDTFNNYTVGSVLYAIW